MPSGALSVLPYLADGNERWIEEEREREARNRAEGFGAILFERQDSLSAAHVTRSARMKADSFIQCRVSAETKAALRAVALNQQQTESAVLKRLLETWLQTTIAPSLAQQSERRVSARAARLYVRLTAQDRRLLQERALARHLPAATYVSALVRSHLNGVAPLPTEELRALKRSIAELAALGRNLNQIARTANHGSRTSLPAREELGALVKVCEGLRDHVRGLIKANLVSWETGDGNSIR